MSLKTKAIILLSVSLIAMVASVYGTSRLILLNGLSRIEEYQAKQSVQRTLNVLSQTDSELETTLTDWAVWDDTYTFVNDVNVQYVQKNLTGATFTALKLNVMLFVDSSGQVVFSKGFNLDNGKEVPVSPQLLDNSTRNALLANSSGQDITVSGLVLLKAGPMIIASQPILKSDYTGPARGTLIFGRYLNATELSRYSLLTLTDVSLHRTDGVLDSDLRKALQALSGTADVSVQMLSTKTVAGYKLLRDIGGNPVLILRVAQPRDASALGQNAVFYHILAVLGIGLLIITVGLLTLQKQVVSRFAVILSKLKNITMTGDITTKLPVSGNDEITLMARTINGMLTALEEDSVELRAREERYRLLAENAQDVIFTADLNFNFRYISPSISMLTGYSVEEATGKAFTGLLTSTSQEAARKAFVVDISTIESVKKETPKTRTVELEIVGKDGSPRWVEANMNLLTGEDNQPDGILGVLRDISERKRADIVLTTMYESEKKLRQELQEEISKRTEYTRALVHELKTPITPIIAASDLLMDKIKEPPLSNLVGSISRSAFNLNRRVDELLDLARSELNILRIYPETSDPVLLLTDIANEMIPVGLSKGLSIKADLPPSLPAVKMDKDRIKQVVLNLMNNAIKFTPSGGKITLSAGQEGSNLVVSVTDTGMGISEEQQKRIFDPYHLVAEDRQRLSGLGLGLTLAKQFVELHGGRLWVNSAKGKGSTFSFSLPLVSTQ